MGYLLKTYIGKDCKEHIYKKQEKGSVYYVVINQDNTGMWVTKDWLLKARDNISNLRVTPSGKLFLREPKPTALFYHGSDHLISGFDTKYIRKYPGFWFAENPEYANEHGDYVYTVRLNIKNMIDLEAEDEIGYKILEDIVLKHFGAKTRAEANNILEQCLYTPKMRECLIHYGYDSISWMHKNSRTVIVLHPNQIEILGVRKKDRLKGMSYSCYYET